MSIPLSHLGSWWSSSATAVALLADARTSDPSDSDDHCSTAGRTRRRYHLLADEDRSIGGTLACFFTHDRPRRHEHERTDPPFSL